MAACQSGTQKAHPLNFCFVSATSAAAAADVAGEAASSILTGSTRTAN
jgi:hypothetical protein